MNRNGKNQVVRIMAGIGAGWLVLALSAGPARPGSQSGAAEEKIKAFENGLTAFSPGGSDAKAPSPKAQSLSERMAFYKVPGVSIALLDGFSISWAKGYGEIKAGSGKAVTPDSLFEAASTTKVLVAALVLHYVGQGRFDLDADVNSYLKSWKVPENEFTRKEKVTLRRLLTHRAGLPKTNMDSDDKAGGPTLIQVLKGEAPAENKPAVPEAVPGSRWQYSNVGYVLIQFLLEDALGAKLESVMADVLYRPLKLEATTLTYPLPAPLAEREAVPHDNQGRAAAPAMHPSALAQGGLMTTPTDLAKVLIELMQSYRGASPRLLTKEMARAMFRPEVELDPQLFGTPASDGLGMFIKGQGEALTVLHPGKNFPGSICWMIGFPEQGRGAIVMLNGANGEGLALEILTALGRVYGWPPLM